MIAYRAETAMANLLRDKVKHPDESRSLIRALYKSDADLLPDEDAGTLNKLVAFIGHPCTPAVLEIIRQRSSFDYMKNKTFSIHKKITQLEGFFRKGRIGSWKNQFMVSQSEAFDHIYTERMADDGLDLVFKE